MRLFPGADTGRSGRRDCWSGEGAVGEEEGIVGA